MSPANSSLGKLLTMNKQRFWQYHGARDQEMQYKTCWKGRTFMKNSRFSANVPEMEGYILEIRANWKQSILNWGKVIYL